MPLNIKDAETHDMARKLARVTGETLTEAVRTAIRERLDRLEARQAVGRRRLAQRLEVIAKHCASLPVLDDRTPDELLGYDDKGLPR